MVQFYILLSISVILNLIFIFNIDKLTAFFKFYDYPQKKRKIHKSKISLLGGSIFFICLNIYFLFDYFYFKQFLNFSYLSLFLSFSLFFVIGVIDDKKDIKAIIKSIYLILIILFILLVNENLVIQILQFTFLETEINLNYFSVYFTIFCIFLFINAFNMYDGINGQAGFYAAIIFSYLLFKGILIELSLIFLICSVFFLYANLRNKLFLGDNGSLLIALLISLVIIKSYNENLIHNSDEIFVLMMLPGIDMARLFIERILKKKNPLVADNQHFHHLLMKKYSTNHVLLINSLMIILPIVFMNIGLNILYIILIFLTIYSFLTFILKN